MKLLVIAESQDEVMREESMVLEIKLKSLILAQSERWRRG